MARVTRPIAPLDVRRPATSPHPTQGAPREDLAAAGHVEAAVVVAGLDDRAARPLGRRYGRDAVFAWTPDTWRLLSCRDTRSAAFGWTA
ncbi:hypothetical protein AAH991_30805 [Microbispora sp. ZYX-F-249]|uniref:Uncharacterized protein n=1 Tax=Microbispora maris TaxID=3144104 RepID=A0ABV0AZJ3_9ACTN